MCADLLAGGSAPSATSAAAARTPEPGEGAGPPIPYMQRTRAYYLALGYENPYRWAHFRDVPFTPLAKPLGDSTVALVTTAAPYRPELGDQGPGAPYNGAAKFFEVYSAPADAEAAPDVRISHVSYDRTHTTREGPRDLVSAQPPARSGVGRARRPDRAPLPRPPDEPEPAHDPRPGLPGAPAAGARRRGGRGRPRRQLTGVPPVREPGRPVPRGARNHDGGARLRPGHRRALRRAALRVQRLPPRQRGGPPLRRGLAAHHARSSPSTSSSRPARRAPPSSRRSSGARTRAGRSTSAT